MTYRIGVIGILLEETNKIEIVNTILHDYSYIITGRMGIPQPGGRDINVISLVVDGSTDDIGSLTGKLGNVTGVSVKSALSKTKFERKSQ